jgi:putative SOS response-associated peptidase YedK
LVRGRRIDFEIVGNAIGPDAPVELARAEPAGLHFRDWVRTFAIITTDANELVADIHDRMPAILAPADYTRWLGEEPDPRDLMRPYPAELMRIWLISTRVNKPENDDAAIVEPIEVAASA